jgi:CCR4-NOT transcriptional regulation complex NOT5 subunit
MLITISNIVSYNRNWRYHKELKTWLTKDPSAPEMLFTKTPQYEKGVFTFWDLNSWCKVNREFILYYDMLEDRETERTPSSSTTVAQTTAPATGSLLLVGQTNG